MLSWTGVARPSAYSAPMPPDVFLLASHYTPFARHPDRDHASLVEEAYRGLVLGALGAQIDRVAFGNCAMHLYGQSNLRGQVVLDGLRRSGELPDTAPIANVEGACATGGMAFLAAFEAVRAGDAGLALALGVEKTFHPDPLKILELFSAGIDQLHPERWQAFYAAAAAEAGLTWQPHPQRIVFLDVGVLQARWHQGRHGSTDVQLAAIAAKNHANGALNDKAQYRQALTAEQILADKVALAPLRRSMCAPISDGAAAALLCDERTLAKLPHTLRRRAVRVASVAASGGRWRALGEETVSTRAARRALSDAGCKITDVDVIELHDATAFAELRAYEELGLCAPGEGGRYADSGASARTGDRPVNLSGGLEAKGHPLAATGLAMVTELHQQLLGEAGPRQASRATRALFHNAGGQVGFDEALAVVGILERAPHGLA